MGLYEDIVRERAAKNPDYRNGLISLFERRRYHERISALQADINNLEGNLRSLRARDSTLVDDWMRKVRLNFKFVHPFEKYPSKKYTFSGHTICCETKGSFISLRMSIL